MTEWTQRNPIDKTIWPNRDPISELGGINLYRFALNAPIHFIDPSGDEPVTVAVVTTAICSAIYAGGKAAIGVSAYRTKSKEQQAYRDTLRRLENKYGDCLPEGIQNFMDKWRNDLLCGFGSDIAPVVEGVPGTSFTGPVSNPKPSSSSLPKPPRACPPKNPCPPQSPSFPTREQNMGIDQVNPFGL